jgi:hypothetical protein
VVAAFPLPNRRVCLTVLLAGCCLALPSPLLAGDLVEENENHVAALNAYVDSQIALKQKDLDGLRELRQLGHASVQEVSEAQIALDRLHARRTACTQMLEFTDDVKRTDPTHKSNELVIVDVSHLLGLPDASFSPLVVSLSSESRSMLDELRELDEQSRHAESNVVGVRLGHANEMLNRLQQLVSPMRGELAEIERLTLQIQQLKAEQHLIASTPAVVRVIDDARYQLGDQSLSVTQLATVMEHRWQACRLTAESTAVATELAAAMRHHERLKALETAGKSLVGELERSASRLRRLESVARTIEEEIAQLESESIDTLIARTNGTNLDDDVLIEATMIRGDAARQNDATLEASRHRLEQVAQLAETDSFFDGELDWLSQKVRLREASAKLAARRSRQLSHIAQSSWSGKTRFVSMQQNANSSLLTSLIELPSTASAQVEYATVALEIADERLRGLEQLRREGHASWREVQLAKVDVDVCNAELEARNAEQAAERVRGRLFERIVDTHPAVHDTLR